METPLADDVRIFQDPESLAVIVAGTFADAAARAIMDRDVFSVALSGGSTPRLLFRTLATSYRDAVPWGKVHLFWTDERMVPQDHELSNYRLAHDELISRIAIPAGNIHRIPGELQPEEAAAFYDAELRRWFGSSPLPVFDLILLGVGEDGHTASLFPGDPALSDIARLAVPAGPDGAGIRRVTLTLPVLRTARRVLFLVTGSRKSAVVAEILGKTGRERYPAGRIDRATWLLDRAAAAGLVA